MKSRRIVRATAGTICVALLVEQAGASCHWRSCGCPPAFPAPIYCGSPVCGELHCAPSATVCCDAPRRVEAGCCGAIVETDAPSASPQGAADSNGNPSPEGPSANDSKEPTPAPPQGSAASEEPAAEQSVVRPAAVNDDAAPEFVEPTPVGEVTSPSTSPRPLSATAGDRLALPGWSPERPSPGQQTVDPFEVLNPPPADDQHDAAAREPKSLIAPSIAESSKSLDANARTDGEAPSPSGSTQDAANDSEPPAPLDDASRSEGSASDDPAAAGDDDQNPATDDGAAPAAQPEAVDLFGPFGARDPAARLQDAGGFESDAPRTWSTVDAQRRWEARLVAVSPSTAVFVLPSGAETRCDLTDLSTADLQFVRRQIQARQRQLAQQRSQDPSSQAIAER